MMVGEPAPLTDDEVGGWGVIGEGVGGRGETGEGGASGIADLLIDGVPGLPTE